MQSGSVDFDLSSSASKRPRISEYFERLGESNTLLTCLSLVTGSHSPHDVSSAMCVMGQPLTIVPPDDSMECLGQFESRGSPSGSEEQRISKFGLTECVYV